MSMRLMLMITLLLPITVFAQQDDKPCNSLQHIVDAAITKYEQTDRTKWRYQVSRYENEEGNITSSIEQHLPASDKDTPWSLIKLNGNTPSQTQRDRFTKQKKQQLGENNNDKSFAIALSELIDQTSLTLVSENDVALTMTFNVVIAKLGDDAKDKLTGRLIVNKTPAYIKKIIVTNTKTFSPMFGAKITDLELIFEFIEINRQILPKQQGLKMKGTFAFFTEINEESLDTYTDYQFIQKH